MSRNMVLNINTAVLVRLTSLGKAAYRAHMEPVRKILGDKCEHTRKPDAEGRTRFQLWELMSIFGPHTGMAMPLMFECDIEIPTLLPAVPDFDAIRDKSMSELTPKQQDDALELWLRENKGWMGQYHQGHYEFLLRRLDEARTTQRAA